LSGSAVATNTAVSGGRPEAGEGISTNRRFQTACGNHQDGGRSVRIEERM